MAFVTDEVLSTEHDQAESSSDAQLPVDNEEVEQLGASINEEPQLQAQLSLGSNPEDDIKEAHQVSKRRDQFKARSVSFAPTVEEFEIPARSSFSSDHASNDFLDALVESYRVQSSTHLYPLYEEKPYVPKTNRTRLNPNWREHRTRHLMNKLEELSLWDREEEMKASQAQFLREQKLEQIQDRQRNHDLCLHLMRQRHESEMESAVLLDRAATGANDELTRSTIAQAMHLASPAGHVLGYDLPMPPLALKRRVQHEQEQLSSPKTPIGRFRQFETTMSNKQEKINDKLQPDREIMRAFSPYYTSIPPTVVPLFSETYARLLALPETYSSNKYNQYHYGVTSCFHPPQHASSPDYETRLRLYSNRDVRVPLKDHSSDDDNDDEDQRGNSRRRRLSPRSSSSPVGRANQSLLYSRPPTSHTIHQRSLNDDLNAITRSSSSSHKSHVPFIDLDHAEDNAKYQQFSKMKYQPEILSLPSTRSF